MALTEPFTGSETIGTTEWSLTTDTSGPDANTTAGVYQCWVDYSALAKGDVFELRCYEKVTSGGTQRRLFAVPLSNAQSDPGAVTPSLMLMHGWDFTLVKISGTDRAITWSIRAV